MTTSFYANLLPSVIWTLALMISAAPSPAEDFCESGLTGSHESPIAYQNREDNRCEGIYKLEVNSSHVYLSSLTEVVEEIDPMNSDLKLEWTVPPNLVTEQVRLKVGSLSPKIRYRMDTRVEAGSETFAWPGSILHRQGLSRKDLGILGWFPKSGSAGAEALDVYLPLRFRSSGKAGRNGVYTVTFVPRIQPENVSVSVTPVPASGSSSKALPDWKDRDLGWMYYPADQPLDVELPRLPSNGLYEVEIVTTFKRGDAGKLQFLLYHEDHENETR